MSSDWDRQRTLNVMFSHATPQQRIDFIERQKAEQAKADGKQSVPVVRRSFIKEDEALTGQLGMVTPRPMMVNTLPGTEVRDDLAHSASTGPDEYDGHTHTAYYDEAGNGYTSVTNDHTHEVRSFIVTDHQSPHGGYVSKHPEVLPRVERTPGSEYKSYDGVM